MRRLLAPLVLVLALAGCGDDGGGDGSAGSGGSSGSGGRTDADLAAACDPVDGEPAASIIGLPVTRRDQDLPGGVSCTYYGPDEMGYLNVVVVAEDGSFDSLADLTGDDVDATPIEIPGSEEAVLVEEKVGIAITQLLARGDGVVFTVYPTGLTREDEIRSGRAALTVLLGGEVDPADVVDRSEVPHPCDQLTEQEAAAALGAPVTVTRSEADSSTTSCSYETGGAVSVLLLDLGGTSRVDQVASGANGTAPEEFPAPAGITAFARPDADAGRAEILLATDRTVLDLSVDAAGTAQARQLAERLVEALAP